MTQPIPADHEARRLRELRKFNLLGTRPEQVLDDLTTLAAQICATPIAFIALIDQDRGWLKSKVGWDAIEVPRDSLCTNTLLQRDLLVVPDATQDERFLNSALVTEEPHIRFYAGAALIAPAGYAIGTLCVVDRVPRTLTPMQQEALRVLSEQVMAQLELRRQTHELAATNQTLTAVTESLAAYVERGDWKEAMGRLVRSALAQTQSEYGFIGVVLGSTLRVLAHEGIVWDKVINRDFYEQALQRYEEVGYLEFTSFDNLFGRAITTGEVVIANQPDSDSRSSGRPTGHPPMRSFMGVPIFLGGQVQGMVALANRPGGYSQEEQRRIETLIQHAGGLCTSYLQREASILLEQERVAAEEALRESQAHLRFAMESARFGDWDLDLTTDTARRSLRHDQCFGYTEPVAEWGFEKFISHVHPDDRARVESEFRAAATNLTPWDFECRVIWPDGSTHWIRARADVYRKEGKPVRMLGLVNDITARKQAEEVLREAESRKSAILNVALDAIITMDHKGNVSDFNPAAERIFGYRQREAMGRPLAGLIIPQRLRQRHSEGMARYLATGEGPVLGKRIELPALHADGHEFPVELSINRIAGVDSPMFTATLRDITARKQAEATLRVSEERFRLLAKATKDAIWDWDLTTNNLWWNEGYETLFGHARAQADHTFKTWADHIHPDDKARVTEGMQRVIEHGGQSWTDEYRFRCQDGRDAHVLDRGHVIRDAAGKPVRMIGSMTDLTKMKEHEIALSQSNRALQLLSRCNEALIRSETESGLLADICQTAVDVGGFRLAWVGYALDDADKTIVCQSHAGVEQGYLSTVRITWDDNHPAGQGPAGKVIRGGEPVVIPDIENDEGFRPWRESARARGFRGVIALPLADKNRSFGVLVLYLPEVRNPLPDELSLLRELADDMAFGIVNIRSRLDRQRIHAAVEQVAAAVSAATGKDFFEQLARNMALAVGAQAGFVAKVLPGEPITARTIAAVVDNQLADNFDYVLHGTPCESFFTTERCVIPSRLPNNFPDLFSLAALGAQGYVGWRLDSSAGKFLGLLFVIFREPLDAPDFVTSTLRIFAARAAAELEREETDTQLRASEAGLAMAQAMAHLGSWELDLATMTESFSAEMFRLLYRDPALGVPTFAELLQHVHPDDRGVVESALALPPDPAQPYTIEYRTHPERGPLRHLRATIHVVLDDKGQPVRTAGTAQDVTERKKQEARFRRLAESNVQGVHFWNLDGRILDANDALLRMIGRTREDLEAGRLNFFAMTPPEWAEADRRAIVQINATGACEPFEKEYLRPDGTRVPVLLGAACFEDQPDEGVAFVLDLTERKKLEQQFLRAQRMEGIGTLAGGIAHDLNNALAPIIMSLDLLKMNFPDAASQELLEVIATSAQRGADMVRQVLSFARGVEGRRMHVQVEHLLRDVEKIVGDTFPKDIRLRTIVPPQLWSVVGDPTQLHQVLLNLCVNARDAMPNGGVLTLSAQDLVLDAHYAAMNPEAHPGPYVFLQVEDSGTGMPAEVMEKIFDPFFTTKELGKGTGLGLSTSMGIVRSHGGFLRVYSELGKGTTFKVYLPAVAEGSPGVAAEQAAQMPRGNGELILVVDDEASVRQITQQALEAFGYRVIVAGNGAEAVALYDREGAEVAVVLTDMMMPVMDGPATIQALRRLDPAVRIIGASGLSADGHVARAANLGVKHFLPKPYTAESLLTTLQEILSGGP